MSHYCLFIDESGDFGRPNEKARPSEEWIVSGILCPAGRGDLEKMIVEALEPVGKRHGMPTVKNRPDTLEIEAWHLTEMRQPKNTEGMSWAEKKREMEKCNQRANKVAFELFKAMLALPIPMRFIAVINSSRADVSHPEQTYRMMVMDLLALAEASLPDEERIASLDVFVAARSKWINRKRVFFTSKSDLKDVLDTLEPAAEVGLAARGLVDLVSHHLPGGGKKFSLERLEYRESWGLPVSDFLANTVYNRVHHGSAASLDMLDRAGRLSLFTSLGAYEERRSHIAARDSDFGGALYWWAVAEKDTADGQEQFANLLQRTMHVGGAMTARAAVEAMIERFWQQAVHGGSHMRIFRQLQSMETALAAFVGQPPDVRTLPLLFRLRNFMIAMSNHIGDAARGRELLRLQESARQHLPFIPENLFLLMDLDLYMIEIDVNDLEFGVARSRAAEYYKTVESYQVLWKQLNPKAEERFVASRIYHRAFSTWLRTLILAARPLPEDGPVGNDLAAAHDALQRFEALPLHPADRKRATNYRIMALLKSGQAEEALAVGLGHSQDGQDAFDLVATARAVGDALAAGLGVQAEAADVLGRLRRMTGDGPHTNHPFELLWREQGYLERLLNQDDSAAGRCFERSELLLRPGRDMSPVNTWLWHLLQLYRSEPEAVSAEAFAGGMPSDDQGAAELAREAIRLHERRPDLTLLRCARLVSPY